MTMLVLAVLGALAAPAFANLLERGRVQAADQGFVTALHLARETAARRAARTLVCPSGDGMHCADDGRWEAGWIVAIDRDRDGQPDTAPLLRSDRDAIHGSAVRALRLRMQSTSGRPRVIFQPDGSSGGSNVTFLICRTGGHNGRGIVVSNSGRIRQTGLDATQLQLCLAGA
ncbi:MAG: GspH/FimT family pseudopilin [Xanthomonadaceae bacterium]|nr:GspH/FimT family pseudopilin [Xanthomonadaceae bacterium]MDE1958711.1 GspH/FimT family pseudopilin [Xanthomonadaceae bacterium]MDE2177255.1 GspH/FimT family pseudopilin [Xanthomonadaceae bacterium]MDE2245695.1 GspH/FimT family pseudopilin [Xanthomonadaceae bacterium]